MFWFSGPAYEAFTASSRDKPKRRTLPKPPLPSLFHLNASVPDPSAVTPVDACCGVHKVQGERQHPSLAHVTASSSSSDFAPLWQALLACCLHSAAPPRFRGGGGSSVSASSLWRSYPCTVVATPLICEVDSRPKARCVHESGRDL